MRKRRYGGDLLRGRLPALFFTKKIMRGRIFKIKQHDSYDCGAACLCTIAAWFGNAESLAKIRKYCGCTADGITIKGIIEGASKIGLVGKGYKSNIKDITPLANINSPIIAHIETEDGMLHFVVITNVTSKKVTIMDPAKGVLEKYPREKFEKMWSGNIIIFSKGQNFKEQSRHIRNKINYLWEILLLHKKEFILAAFGSIALVIVGLSNSLFLQQIIDKAIPNGTKTLLLFISGSIFMLLLFSSYLGYARTMIIIRNGVKIDAQLIIGYIRKIFKLPLDFFFQYSSGDINSRIEDAYKIRTFVSDGIISAFISVVTFTGTLIVMFIYYGKIAMLVLLSFPLYAIVFYINNKISKKYNRELAVAGAKFETSVIDSIGGIVDIKHFCSEKTAIEKIEGKYLDMSDKIIAASKTVNILGSVSETLSQSILAIIIIVGGMAVLNSKLTIGELVSFYTLCAYFTSPLNHLIGLNSTITDAIVSAERLFEIMELDEEQNQNRLEYPDNYINQSKEIKVNNISFSYIGREELIKNFSCSFKKGAITAIWGESGCGKSTIASLLLRDIIPAKGKMELNDINISAIPIKQWRRYITIVPQQCKLLEGTILENITSGDTEPDLKRVASLCAMLGLTDLISRLPLGIMQSTNYGGIQFSGGELQKISTARALYPNPQIIIFDEATSSLDKLSEQCIINTIMELKKTGKGIIMITHKEENLKIADNIIDLNQNKCVHKGEGLLT